MRSVIFNVNEVATIPANTVYDIEYDDVTTIFTNLVYDKNKDEVEPKFEAISNCDCYYSEYNSFFCACNEAYTNHIPLELTVDHIKLTIVQAFAIHVNMNSDKLKNALVSHNDKKNIIIERNDFETGSDKNPWSEVFEQFAVSVKNNSKDSELIDLIQLKTQTTTNESFAAMNIAIMDTFQKFYDYELVTKCGIPRITLKGSIEDWTSLKQLLKQMEKYDFDWYTNKMSAIIDEFILASEGTPNITFWKTMMKYENRSGGPYYQGWIKYFFPYLKNNKDGGYLKSKYTDDLIITTRVIPSGISTVPVTWIYNNDKINLKFHSGFVGISISEDSVTPQILWAIQNLSDENK
jgi:hypothetical protein